MGRVAGGKLFLAGGRPEGITMKTNSVKKIEAEVLGDLDDPRRVMMLLKAGAARDAETVKRLIDTCPRKTYTMR